MASASRSGTAIQDRVIAVIPKNEGIILEVERHSIGFVDVRFPHTRFAANAMGLESWMSPILGEAFNALQNRGLHLRGLLLEAPLESRRQDDLHLLNRPG